MRARWNVAALLWVSGCCALVHQAAWLREFQPIFGASTVERLLLTMIVPAVPAIARGGTRPAAARAGTEVDTRAWSR